MIYKAPKYTILNGLPAPPKKQKQKQKKQKNSLLE